MLSEFAKKKYEKQKYKMVGSHSAVKTCGWTKSMIKGEGGCYKLRFYGIMSNQCMQMTTSMSCANRCVFCWRDYKAPVSKSWKGQIDEPEFIIENSIKAHHHLLVGLKGFKGTNQNSYEKSKEIRHVALSLTGEPIIYPKINQAIKEFHKKNISTFLVTNAQYPEQIKDLNTVTQLYLSLDAPNKKLLKEIDVPLFPDYWERLNKSLEYLAEKTYRTCIRLTVIKNINDFDLKGYKKLIELGDPDFIEAKGYMHVGASTKRLKFENMPFHEHVVEFSKKLEKHLPDYEIVSEHIPSRVVMLAKKKFKKSGVWFTWIDFEKFFKLISSEEKFTTEDFLKKTPITGISGKGTKERIGIRHRKRLKPI